ncbi:lethal(2) giant larvae protein [Leptidea sinapis]|uniref:lethal(2) giant larvae protein n=1 Tax=Leptidea sinapis TaxID=189913 RepID=UPI0021C319C8|nr:lethal(2) giant larvae protein [Leptidea sinapis]
MAGRMLKFIRGKGQQPSAERQKLQNELFAFRKTVQHGFPHRASALAWDPLLRLAAIGTASGALKVYGRPGVEFYGQHSNPETTVTQIHFIPGSGRLISLCDDNTLHLWEIEEKSLVELKSHLLEGKNKKISSICVEASGKNVLLGTEGGNVYVLDASTFSVHEDAIYQDVVMQNCPEDFKVNPGAVESICEHPKSPSKVLIGYNRGLVVLWDRESATPTHTFVSNQQLESLCWNDEGDHFTSSHNDGSYVTWEVAGAASDRPLKEPITPYGPYPCKAITKILNRTSLDGDEVVIYAGGMPRASYSDKYTVTVQQGEKHVAFDFTSRVIDFFTTTQVPPDGAPLQEDRPATPAQLQMQTVNQVAAALVVLAEEELVVIDLCDPKWRPLRLPYLVSIHASAVTTMYLVDNIADTVYDNIVAAGECRDIDRAFL